MRTYIKSNPLGAALALLLVSATMASAVEVTFRVNMSVQAALGAFTPGVDPVYVAGSFNSWTQTDGPLTQSVTNTDIYEGTFDITNTVGTTVSYKYVYGANGWEADGVGPGGAQNRQLSVPAEPTVLDPVYFNNVDTVPSTRQVTFQVNMSVQRELGNFDPTMDFVQVSGGFNAWSTTASELYQSVSDTNVWEGTFTVPGNTGETANYKFVMATFASGDVWENNDVGPNGAQNRQLTLEASDQTLPVVYFNNLDTVPTTKAVTFQVNMAAQMALGNFVNGVNTVTASGTFNNWDAGTFVLTNDPAEPTIYKGTADVTGPSVSLQYVIDSTVWETAVGDRTYTLADTNQTLAAVFWNNVADLGTVTRASAGENQIDVSWTAGPLVRLQMSTNLSSGWEDVPGTTGMSNATVTVTTDETYLRLIGP